MPNYPVGHISHLSDVKTDSFNTKKKKKEIFVFVVAQISADRALKAQCFFFTFDLH